MVAKKKKPVQPEGRIVNPAKKPVFKVKVDLRLQTIKEIQRKLNSLPFGERIKFAGSLKNGKLDLSKLI